MRSLYSDFPGRFEKECVRLVKNLVPTERYFFYITDPYIHFKFVGANMDLVHEQVYTARYSSLDPMHPRHFEGSDTSVVCNNLMMPMEKWKELKIYKEYYKPLSVHYDTDIFLRRDKKIIAVLCLLRKEEEQPFSQEEIALLEQIQPFMEYTFNEIYKPSRIDERKYIEKKFKLTRRELDVLEYAMSGSTNKTIASALNLSLPTVRTHLQHIYDKVDVHSTSELISRLFQELQ